MVSRQNRQQAAVVFGYDAAAYQSSSAHMNRFAGNGLALAGADGMVKPADNVNKQCHVEFGEKGSKRDFAVASTQLDPTGEMHKYAARLSADNKEMLTRTSAGFGADVAPFVTSTQLATQWNKEAVQETVALRNEIRKRTGPRPTRGISYDDDVEYVSEATSAFENKLKGFKPSVMAESVKNGASCLCVECGGAGEVRMWSDESASMRLTRSLSLTSVDFPDLRATHFTVGHETLDYRTSSHIERLAPDQFALYATRQAPLHDLKKSTVEIT
ncbi:hypothetical protein PybrP1_012462 [[Pythium] brassicae (nom. inval.)]|nr:hypothetical protein PybrP1_012462 [[Pythium] brassicae (nom. inval.)]